MRPEAQAWWQTAQDDFRGFRDILSLEHWHAAAFFAQQAAEKALKALFIVVEREESPRTHNLRALAERLLAPVAVVEAVTRLAPIYTIARYPDAASGRPADVFDKGTAEEAVADAEGVLTWVAERLRQT